MERPRSRSQLPNNLPQLQNLIKRDPLAYKDEVLCVSLVSSPVEIEDFKGLDAADSSTDLYHRKNQGVMNK